MLDGWADRRIEHTCPVTIRYAINLEIEVEITVDRHQLHLPLYQSAELLCLPLVLLTLAYTRDHTFDRKDEQYLESGKDDKFLLGISYYTRPSEQCSGCFQSLSVLLESKLDTSGAVKEKE